MKNLYINEDTNHFFATREKDEIFNTKDFIYQYKDSNVKSFILNANSQCTSYKSDVWNSILDNYNNDKEYTKPITGQKWINAVKEYSQQGVDFYSECIKYLREVDIEPWMSMRMNDVHNVYDLNNIMHSDFYIANLDKRLNMYRDESNLDRQLNYLDISVRKYSMSLIKEYFSRYDFDCIEIDWMRFGKFFPAGYEDEGRIVLNEFMKDVKELASRYEKIRGHKIKIAARVHIRPETSFDLGLDGVNWALKGYIDYLIPSPFWTTSQIDIPIEIWKQLIKGTDVLLLPCFELCLRQYKYRSVKNEYQFNSLETLIGPAISFIDRGADGVYLFNYMDRHPAFNSKDYKKLINKIGTKSSNEELMRFIVTYDDIKAEGTIGNIVLPAKLSKDKFIGFRVHTGNLIKLNNRVVVAAFNEKINDEDITVYVNGNKCEYLGEYETNHPKSIYFKYGFRIPLKAIKNGYHIIEFVSKKDGIILDWVEMIINK